MELETYKPTDELAKLSERIDGLTGANLLPWQAKADWFETDEELILVLDAPGANPNAFEVHHDGEYLNVSGERDQMNYGQARVSERPQGQFERKLQIPEPIQPGSGTAQYRAGLLELRFKKLHKTITVEPG